jgi:hypothetical protein
MIMDEVELTGPRAEMGDVQALPCLSMAGWICITGYRTDGGQLSCRHGIPASKQRDIDSLPH